MVLLVLKYLLISPLVTNCVMRVIAKAKDAQLAMRRNVVNNLPASLSGLTSWKPVVVTVIVVMYNASVKVYFSITMNPMMPVVMMA